LSPKGITLHDISNPNTQGAPNELMTLEKNSSVTIRLKRKN